MCGWVTLRAGVETCGSILSRWAKIVVAKWMTIYAETCLWFQPTGLITPATASFVRGRRPPHVANHLAPSRRKLVNEVMLLNPKQDAAYPPLSKVGYKRHGFTFEDYCVFGGLYTEQQPILLSVAVHVNITVEIVSACSPQWRIGHNLDLAARPNELRNVLGAGIMSSADNHVAHRRVGNMATRLPPPAEVQQDYKTEIPHDKYLCSAMIRQCNVMQSYWIRQSTTGTTSWCLIKEKKKNRG